MDQSATTLVIGHRNPDMDAIAAAVGYAWLLNVLHGDGYRAGRAGDVNAQTAFALSRFQVDMPSLVSDIRPRVRDVMETVPALQGDPTLMQASRQYAATRWAVVLLNDDQSPRGLLSAGGLFDALVEAILDQPDALKHALRQSAAETLDTQTIILRDTDTLVQALQQVKHVDVDDYIVVDTAGVYRGLCRKSEMLVAPRPQVVLVDHNEAGQAVVGIEEADVVDVLDHHRIDSITTVLPIRFRIEPVGSCSTLVAEQAREKQIIWPAPIAGLLLCGILSDTLAFQSVTTTPRDQTAARELARMAHLPGEGDEAIQSLGRELLLAGAGLGTRSVEEIIATDLKFYETERGPIAMSQAEVTQFDEMSARLPQLRASLEQLVREKHLILALLMVTDILRSDSRIIAAGEASLIAHLPYTPLSDGTLEANGVVSRKKQLVPAVLAAVK